MRLMTWRALFIRPYLEAARKRVRDAIGGKASVGGGELVYMTNNLNNVNFGGSSGGGSGGSGSGGGGGGGGAGGGGGSGPPIGTFTTGGAWPRNVKDAKGTVTTGGGEGVDAGGGGGTTAQQVVRNDNRKDPKGERVCAHCGSPHDLKMCAG